MQINERKSEKTTTTLQIAALEMVDRPAGWSGERRVQLLALMRRNLIKSFAPYDVAEITIVPLVAASITSNYAITQSNQISKGMILRQLRQLFNSTKIVENLTQNYQKLLLTGIIFWNKNTPSLMATKINKNLEKLFCFCSK